VLHHSHERTPLAGVPPEQPSDQGGLGKVGADADGSRERSRSARYPYGGRPVGQPAPAGHAAATAHLLLQVLPVNARLEHEEDADEAIVAVRGLLAVGVLGLRGSEAAVRCVTGGRAAEAWL
jgi:hypothetical protein